MAKKKTGPTAREPGKPAKNTAHPPVPAKHDFDRSIRTIVTNSNKPLTLKQIQAMHETPVSTKGSVEDSVLSLVKNNKLRLTSATESTVTLSREAVSRLIDYRPNDAPLTMSVNTVSFLIDDDPVVAVQQVLCVLGYKDVTSRQIYAVLRQLGKTTISLASVENALYILVEGTTGVTIQCYGDPANPQYSC